MGFFTKCNPEINILVNSFKKKFHNFRLSEYFYINIYTFIDQSGNELINLEVTKKTSTSKDKYTDFKISGYITSNDIATHNNYNYNSKYDSVNHYKKCLENIIKTLDNMDKPQEEKTIMKVKSSEEIVKLKQKEIITELFG